jgi:hypothetical protein
MEIVLATAASPKLQSSAPQISSRAIRHFFTIHYEIHLKSQHFFQKGGIAKPHWTTR